MLKHHVIAIATFVFASQVEAAILKDHVSDPSLSDGQGLILQEFPLSFNQTTLAGVAAAFTGDGNVLSKVAGVFATVGSDGSLNNGNINDFRFRISFFASVDDYLADPYGQSLSGGSSLHIVDAPSNADFLQPIGTADQGHDLLVWEFDIESLGIRTTNGATQLVLIHPEIGGGAGGAAIAFSTGGAGAVGGISDYFASTVIDLEPTQLCELAEATSPFAAYRIQTVEIPEPRAIAIILVALLTYAGKSCRSKECH